MIPSAKKFLGLAALAAAASLAPAALASTPASGSVASLNLTIRQYNGDALTGGLVATTTVDLTGVTNTTYADGVGRVRQSVDGLGKITTATYDANGNLLNRTDATGAGTNYAYDNLNRRLTETDLAIAGKVRSYTYDLIGRLTTATDPLGIVTTYAYDLRDRKLSDATPMNGTVTRVIAYAYDGRGDMTTLTDANGAVTTWGFDSAGRQVSKLYANGDTRAMAYDAAGRVVTLTDENGDVITSTYDLAGRLTAKAYAADSGTDTYAYDAASRMTSVTKGRYNHTLTYAYDSAGRLATETHPDGEVVSLAYDAANRLANLSLTPATSAPTTYAVAYAYDTRGLLTTVSTGDYASTCTYRDNGQPLSTVHSQLSTPQGDILRADLSYDAGARLTQVANTAINGDQAGVVYTLGVDDQRLTATEETGQKWQYGYDGLKQLVSANKTDTSATVVPPLSQSYAYDPMGNRNTYTEQGTSVAYVTNNANQYTGVVATGALPGTQSPTYDHNGNMLTDGLRNYTWDADNQLTSVTPVSPVTGSQQVQYAYDWRGRRTTKVSSVYTGTAWGVANTSAYKYAEWNPIEENVTNASTGAVTTKNYVWGNDLSGNMNGAGGVGGLLSQRLFAPLATTPAAYFYAYDGNGNVRALVQANAANPAASAIVERYAYDGFGRELAGSTPAASSVNSFRFSTKQADPETGMNYYGMRFYDANNGRWINRDPIAEKGGNNIYAMIGNGLVYCFDVNGLTVSAFVMPNGFLKGTSDPDILGYTNYADTTKVWLTDGADACHKKVNVSGDGSAKIYYNSWNYYEDLFTISPVIASDLNPASSNPNIVSPSILWSHEMKHANYDKNSYEATRSAFNGYDGVELKTPCANATVAYLNAIKDVNDLTRQVNNNQWDRTDYGGGPTLEANKTKLSQAKTALDKARTEKETACK